MNGRNPATNPVVHVVEALEEAGLDRRDHCLYDVINPDVLERIIATGDPNIHLVFHVEEFEVTVCGDGRIDVLDR